jgi:hypothetical protein
LNKDILLIILVLFLAFLLRAGTFSSLHNSWDEIYYTCVSMKLDAQGFAGYNLQNVGFDVKQDYVRVYVETDKSKALLRRKDLSAYNEPVFYVPPVFPVLLKLSHDAFSNGSDHLFIDHHVWSAGEKRRRFVFYFKELYKTVVPLVFSLLTILMVMLFCLKYFDPEVSFYAGLLLSVNPVDIMASNKIWTDCIFTFFFTATLLLLYHAYQKKSTAVVLVSAIMAGLAMLTRNFGVVLWPIFLIYYLCSKERRIRDLVLFLLVTGAMTAPWFLLMVRTYGTPLHQPDVASIAKFFPFVRFVFHRPWYTYIVNTIVSNPIWIFSVGIFILDGMKRPLKVLLTLWVFVLLLALICLRYFIHSVGIEDRYILPAYPALAIAASFVLSVLMEQYKTMRMLIVSLLLCSCIWSVHIAVVYTYKLHSDCIALPF